MKNLGKHSGKQQEKKSSSNGVSLTRSRRHFILKAAGGATIGLGVPGGWSPAGIRAGVGLDDDRAARSWQIRTAAADRWRSRSFPRQETNGDEDRYVNRIGNFTKTLPHDRLGEVDPVAYQQYLDILSQALHPSSDASEASIRFGRIPVGGAGRLTSPQSGLAFELVGGDPAAFSQPPPPAFASPEIAGEIAENYWMALTRDVSFNDYETDPLTNAAARDLSGFSVFRGPREMVRAGNGGGRERNQGEMERRAVTPATLFRGGVRGDSIGPFVSQFLWLDVPYGSETIHRRVRTTLPGDDYLTSFDDWLLAQVNTGHRPLPNRYDPVRRYLRNGRDLAEWVHRDALFQPYLNAALILLGMNAPVDEQNPYHLSETEIGFSTFGPPHLLSLVTAVAGCALRAVWYQKWYVHRRLRPEEFGARLHNHLTGRRSYPIDREILDSMVLPEVYRRFGSYLLPMAYSEGSPTHPAYGSGHAVVAGACVTVLKAWFREDWVLPNPVVASSDGLRLERWNGADLSVEGELNKLAANASFGRNMGGVHWRSDATESIRLGESIALGFLDDMRDCYHENFDGFALTTFAGEKIRIGEIAP
jgi:hypothetical protein